MPRNRRQLLALTGSIVGITAALAAAQVPASAQDNSTASRPWTVYAVGSSKAISPFPVGASSALAPMTELPLSTKAGSSVISPDGKTLYVISLGSLIDQADRKMFVTPYNTVTRQAGKPIFLGPSYFTGLMALSPDGSTLYVATQPANAQAAILAISTKTRSIRTLVSSPLADDVFSLAISPDGKTLYVGGFNGGPGIFGVDTATGEPTTSLSTNYTIPFAIGVTPDGTTLWAKTLDYMVSGSEMVMSISVSTGDVGATIPLSPTKEGGMRPQDLAISPDGRTAYVNGTGSVIPIDLVTGTSGSPIPFATGGDIVDAIAFTPDGRTVEVAHRLVTSVDTATNVLGKSLKAAVWPISLLITPDQAPIAKLLVTARKHGTATSFNASGSHAVTGHIKTYAWQFGDGQTATTTTPTTTHVYSQAGAYTATLTVTDTAGTSTTVVFTGQSVLRNGGPSAQKSVTLNIS
jgi:sugar lactone lactonase YvrE